MLEKITYDKYFLSIKVCHALSVLKLETKIWTQEKKSNEKSKSRHSIKKSLVTSCLDQNFRLCNTDTKDKKSSSSFLARSRYCPSQFAVYSSLFLFIVFSLAHFKLCMGGRREVSRATKTQIRPPKRVFSVGACLVSASVGVPIREICMTLPL